MEDHGVYPIRDPRWFVDWTPWSVLPFINLARVFGIGDAMVFVSPDQLTIINRPMENHWFEGGQVVRTAVMSQDGTWYVITHGFGDNVSQPMDVLNDFQGPGVFKYLDQRMREAVLDGLNSGA